MTAPRRLLVTGATGKQGASLIKALLADPSQPFEIYAVTRNRTSTNAKLFSKQNVRIVEGNLDNIDAIFAQIPKPVWGVFSVPILDNGIKKEEARGKALTHAAVQAGASHIVFTATERGGQEKSENDPTEVPHFASKFRIEQDIKAAAAASHGHLTYTFLRPVAFFENMPNNFIGRAFVSMWRLDGRDRKLQMISAKDIGKVAAQAFLYAKDGEYRNTAISLAGDELSPNDAARIFKEVTGREIPATYSWLSWLIRMMVADLRHMFAWFKKGGFGTDVQAVRKRYPFMMDFKTWLEEESDWKRE
ncbi:hypothetical protein BT93_L4503 [Corymbia citriodora subsp. variegata]|uniref:NmrA-like domain-containing protein n=1 Tax=Corymbia citriodora subsp. variegata TaxID=360336 RepID=A0A8T0CFR3_CORYI|nr:hypothetical protein BT93_L4503 [Corymbia citriodora subsp. variegata]